MVAVPIVEKPPPTKPPPTWRSRLREARRPALRFTPLAWAKLLFLRDRGPTEVGGFGLSTSDDLLLIEDVRMVTQFCTSVTVQFADDAIADFYDAQVDRGLTPARFGRVWIHTHPGDSAQPSFQDEETFARSFGGSDWAVMFILAQGGQTYARLRFNVGPGGEVLLPVELDFTRAFGATDTEAWDAEYRRCVFTPPEPAMVQSVMDDRLPLLTDPFWEDELGLWDELLRAEAEREEALYV